MNKFEDHWQEKMNDPEMQKDFLKEEVKADMWEKIQASKKGFEQTWQKNADNIETWKGILGEEMKLAMWDRLLIPSLAQFEQQWREKMQDTGQLNGIFPDASVKDRIAVRVFSAKENFESDWQETMNDPARIDEQILIPASKERIWNTIQAGNIVTTGAAPKEKHRPLFTLRWSHAAALLIGAFSTWLIWDRSSAPLQNTLVVIPETQESIPPVNPAETLKEIIPTTPQDVAKTTQAAIHKHSSKMITKGKANAVVKERRDVIERVAAKVTPVKPVQSGIVKANVKPVRLNAGSTAEDKGHTVLTPEKDIATSIVKAPAKKVVHISDIRPAEVHTKGTSIYARAFGEGKEKRKEQSTMTLNSVIKNYK